MAISKVETPVRSAAVSSDVRALAPLAVATPALNWRNSILDRVSVPSAPDTVVVPSPLSVIV